MIFSLGSLLTQSELINIGLQTKINSGITHSSYSNAVFVFYLWLGAFLVPATAPFNLPVADSVKGIMLIITPSLILGNHL